MYQYVVAPNGVIVRAKPGHLLQVVNVKVPRGK